MARRLIIGVLGAVLGCFGCTGDPEDPFFLLGLAQDGREQPLPDVPVKLFRGDVALCWERIIRERAELNGPSAPRGMEPLRETKTDHRGRFLFQLLRYELMAGEGDAGHCYRVDVEGGPDGAKTSVWTTMADSDVYLDRVFRWDEGVISIAPTENGHLLSVTPGPLPPSDAVQSPDEIGFVNTDLVAYEWELTASGEPLWRAEKTAEPFVVDEFLREDFSDVQARANMLGFLATASDPFTSSDGYFELATTPSVLLPPHNSRVPVSRGAPCSSGPKRLDPCAATDGQLDLAVFDTSFQFGSIVFDTNELVFELRTAARPSVAIFRDLQPTGLAVSIEGSVDGSSWTLLGSLNPTRVSTPSPYERMMDPSQTSGGNACGYYRVMLIPPPVPITRIRLLVEEVFGIREVSFFE